MRAVPRQPAINFSMHEVRAGRAGAREDFKQIIALLLRAVTGQDARLVSADRCGDWGIDVLAGDLNGKAAIWQAKYFTRGVGRHQQDQIRKSFNVLSCTATSGVNRRTSLDTRPYCYPDALRAWSTVRKVSGVPRPSLRLGFLCGQVLVAVLLLVRLKQDPQ